MCADPGLGTHARGPQAGAGVGGRDAEGRPAPGREPPPKDTRLQLRRHVGPRLTAAAARLPHVGHDVALLQHRGVRPGPGKRAPDRPRGASRKSARSQGCPCFPTLEGGGRGFHPCPILTVRPGSPGGPGSPWRRKGGAEKWPVSGLGSPAPTLALAPAPGQPRPRPRPSPRPAQPRPRPAVPPPARP